MIATPHVCSRCRNNVVHTDCLPAVCYQCRAVEAEQKTKKQVARKLEVSMTTAQLDSYMAQIQTALAGNAAFFTPDMLTKLQNAWAVARPLVPAVAALGLFTPAQVPQFQGGVDQFLASESMLTSGTETQTIIAAIGAVRNRPAIMWLLAELLGGNLGADIKNAPTP